MTLRNEGKRSVNIILLNLHLKRIFKTSYGVMYLGLALFLEIFIILASNFLGITSQSASNARSNEGFIGIHSIAIYVLDTTYPYLLPFFAVLGSTGATYFFSSDRSSGVYEYLISTSKVRVGQIYLSFIFATVIVSTIIISAGIIFAVSIIYAVGDGIQMFLIKLFLVYSIPLTYVSSMLSSIMILSWASMSKTYQGVNAPGGIGGIIGLIPTLAFLFMHVEIPVQSLYLYSSLYVIAVFAIFLIIFITAARRISNERMIST